MAARPPLRVRRRSVVWPSFVTGCRCRAGGLRHEADHVVCDVVAMPRHAWPKKRLVVVVAPVDGDTATGVPMATTKGAGVVTGTQRGQGDVRDFAARLRPRKGENLKLVGVQGQLEQLDGHVRAIGGCAPHGSADSGPHCGTPFHVGSMRVRIGGVNHRWSESARSGAATGIRRGRREFLRAPATAKGVDVVKQLSQQQVVRGADRQQGHQ